VDLSHRLAVIAGRNVLALAGDLDLSTLPRFGDCLARLTSAAGTSTAVVDLDGVGYLDDAALGLLLGAAGRSRTGGGELVVVASDDRLRRRLTATGFDRAVRVVAAIADA
jgi:anti-anti-sigma factor